MIEPGVAKDRPQIGLVFEIPFDATLETPGAQSRFVRVGQREQGGPRFG